MILRNVHIILIMIIIYVFVRVTYLRSVMSGPLDDDHPLSLVLDKLASISFFILLGAYKS